MHNYGVVRIATISKNPNFPTISTQLAPAAIARGAWVFEAMNVTVLANQRHELFAQAIAKGFSGRAAYDASGFKCKSGAVSDVCASQLLRRPKVAARIAELKSRAADGAMISRQKTLEEMAKIGYAPLGDEHVKTADKRAALFDIAKMEGWIVEKTENTTTVRDITDEPVSEREWSQEHVTAH